MGYSSSLYFPTVLYFPSTHNRNISANSERLSGPQNPINCDPSTRQWIQSSSLLSILVSTKVFPSNSVSTRSITIFQPGLSIVSILMPYWCSQSPLQCFLYQSCIQISEFFIISTLRIPYELLSGINSSAYMLSWLLLNSDNTKFKSFP